MKHFARPRRGTGSSGPKRPSNGSRSQYGNGGKVS